ncbi:MAG: serine hydrolase domain-containing protein [Halodesulfovibrio sp.]
MNRIGRLFAILCCVSAIWLACVPARAGYDAEKVRELITRLGAEAMKDPQLPGISIAVLERGGDTPVTAAFGTANVENSCAMSTDSRFKIGSVTKMFTGALIHRLIEEGRLTYETTIDRFFPQFPDGAVIRIRHLLTHTSGIMDMLSLEDVYVNMTRYRTPEELIAMVGAQPLLFAPGTRQQYSNTGFLMLAVIAEKIAGEPYEKQIAKLFEGTLGMHTLLVGNDTAVVPHLASGYTNGKPSGLQLPIMASLAIARGTGNLEATPSDVVRLVNLDKILRKDVQDTLPLEPLVLDDGNEAIASQPTDNFSTSYLDGCTLFMFRDPEIILVGKLGSFPGFGTAYFYDQKTKIAVAISVNNEMASPYAIDLGARILHELR